MLFISKEGEVIFTDDNQRAALDLYDSWHGQQAFYSQKTSGSTGKPKEVEIKREAILASINQTQKAFNLNGDDFFLCNLNTDYIGGKMMILRAAQIGCDLMVIPPNAKPFEEVDKHRYLFAQNWGKNFFSFVPMQLKNMLKTEPNIQLLRTAKAILVGGAKVDEETIHLVKSNNLPVFETYGMTETASHIALKDLREETDYFDAMEHVEIALDERNCLKIKAPSTLGKWIQTNDLVELLSEKTFRLIGRADNIINSGGVKIQLEEVENLIAKKLDKNVSFFCYGLEDSDLGQKLVLVIENQNINLEEVAINLPKYQKPKEVIILDKFVYTDSEKVDKIQTLKLLK